MRRFGVLIAAVLLFAVVAVPVASATDYHPDKVDKKYGKYYAKYYKCSYNQDGPFFKKDKSKDHYGYYCYYKRHGKTYSKLAKYYRGQGYYYYYNGKKYQKYDANADNERYYDKKKDDGKKDDGKKTGGTVPNDS